MKLRNYETADGKCPYAEWFDSLPAATAARIDRSVFRMTLGNFTACKPVESDTVKGVFERVMDFGPGWRVYYGRDGDELIILLVGGSKRTQTRDIEKALAYWQDYKNRKAAEAQALQQRQQRQKGAGK